MAYKFNRSNDIVLVLKPKEGKSPLDVIGQVDNRIFDGNNNLHAILDTQTCLWYLRYEKGVLPRPFQQRFTSYRKMLEFVTQYYDRRNVEIAEIRDVA